VYSICYLIHPVIYFHFSYLLNYYSNSTGHLELNYKYYSLNYSSIIANPKPLFLLTGENNLPSKKTSHNSISTTIITIYHYSKLIIISNIIITSHSALNHSYLLTKTTINPSNSFAAATTIKKDSNSIIIKILYSISISHFLESNPLYHFLENLDFLNPNPSHILSLQKKKKIPPF
jgi:hypothetical protein